MEQVDFVLSHFKDMECGFFIDVGAYDGLLISNTLKLEEEGWNGICLEPNPTVFKKLEENRTCLCLPFAIDECQGFTPFLQINGYSEMLSGLTVNYDPRHSDRVARELVEHNQKNKHILVPTVPLKYVIENYVRPGRAIDYLSIDTEGSEMAVLRSLDFAKNNIALISLEDNYGDKRVEVEALLGPHGYKYLDTVGLDIFFAKGTTGEH